LFERVIAKNADNSNITPLLSIGSIMEHGTARPLRMRRASVARRLATDPADDPRR